MKSKETGNIIRFFSYFTRDYLLKQEAVVVKPPEAERLLACLPDTDIDKEIFCVSLLKTVLLFLTNQAT